MEVITMKNIRQLCIGTLVSGLIATGCGNDKNQDLNQKPMPVPSTAIVYSPDDEEYNTLGLKRYFIDYGSDGSLEQVWMVWSREGIRDGQTHRTPIRVLKHGDEGFEQQKKFYENKLRPYFIKT